MNINVNFLYAIDSEHSPRRREDNQVTSILSNAPRPEWTSSFFDLVHFADFLEYDCPNMFSLLEEMQQHTNNVAICSRQFFRKSTALMIAALHTALMNPNSTVMWVGHSSCANRQVIREIMERVNSIVLPKMNVTKAFDQSRTTKNQLGFVNGSYIRFCTADSAICQTRGRTINHLVMDEIFHYKQQPQQIQELFHCILPTMCHTDSKISIASTPQSASDLSVIPWGDNMHQITRTIYDVIGHKQHIAEIKSILDENTMSKEHWKYEYECNFL